MPGGESGHRGSLAYLASMAVNLIKMNVAYPMGRSCGRHRWQELEALLGAALAHGLGHQPMGQLWGEFSELGLPP